MAYNNSRKDILLPLIIAVSVIVGIYAGSFLSRNVEKNANARTPVSKLNSMLDFIESEYVDSISKHDIVEMAIPNILEELDPHSMYVPAVDYQETHEPLEGNFEGIGIQFNIQEDTVIVINTIIGGPSEKAGLQAGDRIIIVNDTSIAGIKIKNSQVIKKLKGKKGTKVRLKILRRGYKDLIPFEIIRDQIPINSIDVSYLVDKTIGYIKLSKFSKTTLFEFKKAVTQLKKKGMKNLILDFRGNGGGYLDVAVNLTDEFLEEKRLIVYTQGFARKKVSYFSTERGFCHELEVAVLVDELSASASEIFAGAIQDNDRGIVIGRRTFGKGLVQEPVVFADGSEMRLTIARYYTPSGRCIQRPYEKGKPDYFHEIDERFDHGEFMKADSIKFNDSLKYKTSKGRTVYGGGGIMPDIFVPIDTVGFAPYVNKAVNMGLVYKFAFQFTDAHRKTLNLYTDVSKLENHLNSQNLIQKFISFGEKNKLPKEALSNNSQEILHTYLKAYIARNILDDKGFYPIILKQDKTVESALKHFRK